VQYRVGERECPNEVWWRNTNNRCWSSVYPDSLADDGGVTAESTLPCRVAEYRYRLAAIGIDILRADPSARRWRQIQQSKVIVGNPGREYALGTFPFHKQSDRPDAVARNVLEDTCRRSAVLLEVRVGHSIEVLARRLPGCEHHEAIGISYGQGP
jgi:hypothetical protein